MLRLMHDHCSQRASTEAMGLRYVESAVVLVSGKPLKQIVGRVSTLRTVRTAAAAVARPIAISAFMDGKHQVMVIRVAG
jgi:hypothetical protein